MKTPNARTLRSIFAVICLLGLAAFLLIESRLVLRYFADRSAELDRMELQFAYVLDCRHALDLVMTAAPEELPQKLNELKTSAAVLENGDAFRLQIAALQKNPTRQQFQAAAEALQQIEFNAANVICGAGRQNDDMLYRTFLKGTVFLILFALLLLAGYTFVSRHLRKALQSLRDGTRELRNGNLDYRFREITPDEIGEVKYDFNMMSRRIEQQSAELLNANQGLREQAEKLIEAHQHKDRFLSNMSHELRTPLNSIIGFSELIEARAGKLTPEKELGYAKRILTAAGHLLSLITALLDLAKSGAGTLKAVPADMDLSFTIAEMCEMLSPLAAKKGLEVKCDIEPDLHICADARMIRQIFINLFGNAVKYTFEGFVAVRLKRTGNVYRMEIEDSGIGIPEKEQKNLFRDFYRVESAANIAVDGVGIGLALSRRLAALNNGTINFTSVEGKGSTFVLELGAEKADQASG